MILLFEKGCVEEGGGERRAVRDPLVKQQLTPIA
jgi:hypothetical protein